MPLAQLQTRTELLVRTERFTLRLAEGADDLAAAQRLRFNVFNLELGEGLAESFQTGRDADAFDEQCDHLLLTEKSRPVMARLALPHPGLTLLSAPGKLRAALAHSTPAASLKAALHACAAVLAGRRPPLWGRTPSAHDELIGTYRLQTYGMAQAGRGFYAATEFDLSSLPAHVQQQSIELERACIAPAQRHSEALWLLWRGIAAYAQQTDQRYLFGCCSLRSQQPRDGWVLTRQLGNAGHLHPRWYVPPRAGFECDDLELIEASALAPVTLPKLLQSYLRFGAKVCGPPALDRQFGVIDFFTLFDFTQLNERARKLLGT